MGGSRHLRTAILVCGLFLTATSLQAGSPGPTSRATVLISITVPPRHQLKLVEIAATTEDSRGGVDLRDVCLLGNAPGYRYSVSVLRSEGYDLSQAGAVAPSGRSSPLQQIANQSAPGQSEGDRAAIGMGTCSPSERGPATSIKQAPRAVISGHPITLLIVPD